MPLSKLKKVWDYCSYNVVFFIFLCLLIFFFNLIPDYSTTYFGWEVGRLTQVIVLILLNGYGMIIAHDRINHGYRLPKIIPSDVVNFGIKSTIVYAIFVSFQTFFCQLLHYYLAFRYLICTNCYCTTERQFICFSLILQNIC